jgi:hypothetical protein
MAVVTGPCQSRGRVFLCRICSQSGAKMDAGDDAPAA